MLTGDFASKPKWPISLGNVYMNWPNFERKEGCEFKTISEGGDLSFPQPICIVLSITKQQARWINFTLWLIPVTYEQRCIISTQKQICDFTNGFWGKTRNKVIFISLYHHFVCFLFWVYFLCTLLACLGGEGGPNCLQCKTLSFPLAWNKYILTLVVHPFLCDYQCIKKFQLYFFKTTRLKGS